MSWIAAILVAGSAASASVPTHPLQLQVKEGGDTVMMSLVGRSPLAWSGRYELEVAGGPNGASNHSVQRGTATIAPGATVTVATVKLGNRAGAAWAARLHVTPASGEPYELEWHSAH